jgi:hypothetical protein
MKLNKEFLKFIEIDIVHSYRPSTGMCSEVTVHLKRLCPSGVDVIHSIYSDTAEIELPTVGSCNGTE